MESSMHIYCGKTTRMTMDNILANDVRNQLQSNLGKDDFKETGKFEVGVKIDHHGFKKFKNMNFFYRDERVIVGNDLFSVVSLRSYDTIIGFRWMGKIYIIGKYSTTTNRQINEFAKSVGNPEIIYYNRREA